MHASCVHRHVAMEDGYIYPSISTHLLGVRQLFCLPFSSGISYPSYYNARDVPVFVFIQICVTRRMA